jgi:hypothetical protein
VGDIKRRRIDKLIRLNDPKTRIVKPRKTLFVEPEQKSTPHTE